MKSHALTLLAALAAAATLSTAIAQQAPNPPKPAVPYVVEPTASTVKKEGPEAEVEAQLVQALNADASLKGAKIAVAAEKDTVTLTGVTVTREQRETAARIATEQVGEGKVINAILSEQA